MFFQAPHGEICSPADLAALQTFGITLIADLQKTPYVWDDADATERTYTVVTPRGHIDYGAAILAALTAGVPVACPAVDTDDFATGGAIVSFYPRFFARLPTRTTRGIVLHEMVHFIDRRLGYLGDAVVWTGRLGKRNPPLETALFTEYRAAYIQARFYHFDECPARIFAEAYLRFRADPAFSAVDEGTYFASQWTLWCL